MTDQLNDNGRRPVPAPLVKLYKRRKHFARKRRFADAFDEAGDSNTAHKLRECGETQSLVCCHSCRGHWWVTTQCRLRVCPICSYKKAQERARFIQAMCKDMAFPKLLTLTMPRETGDPREGIKHLRSCWNLLRRHPLFASVKGGVYNIELVRKPDGWHIHMHVLMCAPYLPYRRIFSAWSQITGEEVPQVDIRAATTPQSQAYAAKYASKTATFDATPEHIVAWFNAVKGSRLFASFGKWYNAKVEDLLPDKLSDDWEPECPHCGAIRSSFFARDGPFLYGHDLWRDIRHAFLPDGVDTRPVEGAAALLDDPSAYELEPEPLNEEPSA